MVFSSYIFLCAFLPIVLIGYYMLSKIKVAIWQKTFLVCSSLFFYGYYNIMYLLIILSSIVVNYFIAICMQNNKIQKYPGKKKAFLICGIIFNVALIGYFKYFDFFIDNINRIFGTDFVLKNLLLPLGISFFTFQQLSFLISIYKREEEVGNILDYFIFVTFFPQLVAGPIVLYSEMIPQFKNNQKRYFNVDNFAKGIYMFSIGLFKKAAVADTFAFFANAGFGMTNLGLAAGWITSLCYTFQIFFDFSGYSDMAIGLGKMFNIDLPVNFLQPYKSESITEFWRKWHVTLGRALSTYIYKPLGGNRNGLPRTCLNLFLTFLVSGLWHGAAWTFVLWGALHGSFVVLERIFKTTLDKIPKTLRIIVTFLIVNTLWVLFRAENFTQALNVYKGMLNFNNLGGIISLSSATGSILSSVLNAGFLFVFAIIIMISKCNSAKAEEFYASRKTAFLSAVFLSLGFLCLSRETIFIYFNF